MVSVLKVNLTKLVRNTVQISHLNDYAKNYLLLILGVKYVFDGFCSRGQITDPDSAVLSSICYIIQFVWNHLLISYQLFSEDKSSSSVYSEVLLKEYILYK